MNKLYRYIETAIPGLLASAAITFGLALLAGPENIRLVVMAFGAMCLAVLVLAGVK